MQVAFYSPACFVALPGASTCSSFVTPFASRTGSPRSARYGLLQRHAWVTPARNVRSSNAASRDDPTAVVIGDAVVVTEAEEVTELSPELPSTSISAAAAEPAGSSAGAAAAAASRARRRAAAAAAAAVMDAAEPEMEDIFASQELVEELKDRSQLGRRGEAWFLASLAAIGLVAVPPMQLKGIVSLAGTLALTAGIVFILYALISLGRNLSPMAAPRKKHVLVTDGMYSYVRHPMYSGTILAAFGLAALTMSEARLAMAALLWWILERKVELEERLLEERYAEYEQYKTLVPKFFPFT